MVDAGLIVLASFISPSSRTPDGTCVGRRRRVRRSPRRHRPVRGRTARRQGPLCQARRGELTNFTGIDSPTRCRRIPRSTSTPAAPHRSRRPTGSSTTSDAPGSSRPDMAKERVLELDAVLDAAAACYLRFGVARQRWRTSPRLPGHPATLYRRFGPTRPSSWPADRESAAMAADAEQHPPATRGSLAVPTAHMSVRPPSTARTWPVM